MYWSDILGQPSCVDFLRAALRSGRLPHAVLLWGSAGVGKRSCARALAAAALCRSTPAGDGHGIDEACGACISCREFSAGVHPDYLAPEIDDESRFIKIEVARELIHETNMKSVRSDRKVVLLPKAERLGEEAQNALLKSLEEPAGSTLWILTAEDPARLLGTVRSRSSHVRFARLSSAVVADVLVRADGIDEARARELAASAEGSISTARRMATEDWVEERAFVRDEIVSKIGRGPSVGPAIARSLVKRGGSKGAAGGARRKAKRTDGNESDRKTGGLEEARRPALRLLTALGSSLRDRMRGASQNAEEAEFWAGKLQVVLDSEAAIRQNVRLELVLTMAAARLATAALH
jgi:DNA polymerase III delta' subunit